MKNIYRPVPKPKSKSRCQLDELLTYTQVAIVKSPSWLRRVVGRLTYPEEPSSFTPLLILPETKLVLPESVAVYPFPLESEADVPLVSSNL